MNVFMLIDSWDYEGFGFPSIHATLESAIEASGISTEKWDIANDESTFEYRVLHGLPVASYSVHSEHNEIYFLEVT